VRIGIAGGGLAGSLLAWRLATSADAPEIELVSGTATAADATAASGGAVRAYETDPALRSLAAASLAELLASRTLREWAGYRPTGAIYLRLAGPDIETELADIEASVPGSARRLDGPAAQAELGLAGLPADAVAIVERDAGYVSPNRLRDRVRADAAAHPGVTLRSGPVDLDRAVREYDALVLATGPWTPGLLAAGGRPRSGYRTKCIQYCVHRTGDWRPPHFVDELTGVYGRPTDDGGLLLGVPTPYWDVDPDHPPVDRDLPERAAAAATARFPALRLGAVTRQVAAADCYTEPPGLALRRLDETLFTFTGGSGGSVKTALAASARAAAELVAAVA
jgi:glycine/D-amino acid oxidase-like deaminating enzyme